MSNLDRKDSNLDKKAEKMAELQWIRIFTPIHIPRYLIEQVRSRDFSIEDFFTYQETNCISVDQNNSFTLNPLNQLWLLVDPKHIAKGFLWFTINPLSKDVFIQTFSVDKEYWGGGRAVRKLEEFVSDLAKKADLKKIYWITNCPKHSKKHGFEASKNVLMEYTIKKEALPSKRE